MMTVKEKALQTIGELPEDVDWQEIRDRIDFILSVQKGLDELDAGKGIPVEEVETTLQSWLSR